MVLCFTFQSMIHFELIFVMAIRSVSKLFFFYMNVQSCFFLKLVFCSSWFFAYVFTSQILN